MPKNLTLRGAVMRNFDVRQQQDGNATFARIHFSADFSAPIREEMGWDELPEGYKDAALKGELAGVELMLKPNGKELDRYAFKMPIRKVCDFKVISLKQGEDEADEQELRFTVITSAKRAYVTLGQWIENIGTGVGVLKISYEEGQAELEGVSATDEQRQATLAAAD